MVLFLASLLRCFLNVFSSRKSILSENAVLGGLHHHYFRQAA